MAFAGSKTNAEFRDMTQTPTYLFKALDAEFNFCLDAAALPETALCKQFITPEIDSLSVSWGDFISPVIRNPFVWLNPPYSNILPWIKKCQQEQQNGIGSVVLVPEDSTSEWWPGNDCSEIRRIVGYYDEKGKWKSGRIAFVNAETGIEMQGNNKGSNLIIFIPGCRHHIGTKHVSKGHLLTFGNSIIKLEAERDQQLIETADQPDTDIHEPVDVEAVIDDEPELNFTDECEIDLEEDIEDEELDEPEPDDVEDEPDEDYSDKTVEQLHEEHPDTWQRTMIMLSILFGRKEAYSHREIQFAGSALLTDGEMTGTIAEYENAKAIDEALTKFAVWNKPSPTVAHYLVCGMLDEYKYPANKTLTDNLKLLERLHAGEEPALEPVNLDGPITDVGTTTESDPVLEQQVENPVMSREWLFDKFMQLDEFSELFEDLKQESIDKTIQAIDDINDEYSSDPDAPKAEGFIEEFFASNPNVRTYLNIRSLRAVFRNLVSAAIAKKTAA